MPDAVCCTFIPLLINTKYYIYIYHLNYKYIYFNQGMTRGYANMEIIARDSLKRKNELRRNLGIHNTVGSLFSLRINHCL